MAPTTKIKVEKGPPGRPKSEVWTLGFRRVLKQCARTQKTIHAAYCVICTKVLCNTASKRLTAHRRICSMNETNVDHIELINAKTEAEFDMKDASLAPSDDATITFIDMDSSQNLTDDTLGIENSSKTEYEFVEDSDYNLEHFKVVETKKTTADQKIEAAAIKFFIGCNIPLEVADSIYYKKFCLSLSPYSKLVTREQLDGPLLDKIYSKIHKEVKVNPYSVMLIDEWKNDLINTKNVTVVIRTENNETLFLNTFELSDSKDIVSEVSDIVKTSILEAYEDYKTEVYAIILGNNLSLMKLNSLNVWQFPCNAYIVKLLTKEFIPQDFVNTICKILKQLNLIFKDDELESKVSSDKRYSETKCILEYCITNITTIQSVISSENVIGLPEEFKGLFFEKEFVGKIESCIRFLNCVNELTAVVQNPKSNLADAIEQWLHLQTTQIEPKNREKIEAMQSSIFTTHSLVANYLHPTYRGKQLSDDQMNNVEEFLLNELDSEGLNSLQAFVNRDTIFRVLNKKEGLNYQTYWSLARRTHNNLSTVALKLLMIPASITSSFCSNVNDIKNTSLKPEKIKKLLAVHCYLKENEKRFEI